MTVHTLRARRPRDPLMGIVVTVEDLVALRAVRLPRREGRADQRGALGGARATRLRGRGIDFSEVRLYQPGDDVRSIDWRVTARKAKVHTKVYREERERPTLVLVDQRRAMFFGSRVRTKSVAAAETAALLAWHAVDGGDRVGGLVIDDEGVSLIRPRRDPRTVVRFLAELSRANHALSTRAAADRKHSASESLERAFDCVLRIARNGYRIYLISDFAGLEPSTRRRLLHLARHNSIVAVRLFDPLEAELPPPDHYAVTDGNHRIAIDSGVPAARHAYHARFLDRAAALEAACRSARAQLIVLATNESVASRLSERLVH